MDLQQPDQSPKTQQQPMPPKYGAEAAQVFGVAFEMGFIIALPIVALALFGKWLDARYDKHLFLYIGIVLALASSSLWIYKRLKSFVERLKAAAKPRK